MKPLGMHFSGHGIQNKKNTFGVEFYEKNKNKGDFLLLETEAGEG